ncbi:MAG: TdeIII family type II restriction endonuclease [Saprospiraceae bacterium]|nr:TdeIII family type II restriction endonuclease [Saprospiraceae bacterium]
MAATTKDLIFQGFQIHNGSMSNGLKLKIEMIASHYESVEAFLCATRKDFDSLVFKVDNAKFKLSDAEYAKIYSFQTSGTVDGNLSVEDNFVKILTIQFVQRQLDMIDKLEIETLNVNPILAGALNLDNEADLIRYYAYQAVSRSMVTSVGFLVQNLLLYASESTFDGKYQEHGIETKWDLVVEKKRQPKAFLEIKSGPNDLNKSQIHHFEKEIIQIEKQGFKAFIGETYGKRGDKTITHELYKRYLPNWEKRTLIGKELWEFVSGQKNYHEKLVDNLFKTSKQLLQDDTFIMKIEQKIKPLSADFIKKYKSYNLFLKSLW